MTTTSSIAISLDWPRIWGETSPSPGNALPQIARRAQCLEIFRLSFMRHSVKKTVRASRRGRNDMRRNWNLPRGEVQRLEIDSKALAGNLLGDPTRRDLPVYLPPGFKSGDHLPLLVDLVGFTGSGQSHINWKNFGENAPGAARPADRRGQDAAGGSRLSRLLQPAGRQSIHQQRRDRPLRGLPAGRGRATGRKDARASAARAGAASSANPPAATAPSSMPCAMRISGPRPPAIPATWPSSSAIWSICPRC